MHQSCEAIRDTLVRMEMLDLSGPLIGLVRGHGANLRPGALVASV